MPCNPQGAMVNIGQYLKQVLFGPKTGILKGVSESETI
jgi:hypothetical protein